MRGFFGVVARLELDYAGDPAGAPPTCIAKLPSPDPGSRQIDLLYGLYEREVRFYTDLAPGGGRLPGGRRPPDLICQTRTRNAAGAYATDAERPDATAMGGPLDDAEYNARFKRYFGIELI